MVIERGVCRGVVSILFGLMDRYDDSGGMYGDRSGVCGRVVCSCLAGVCDGVHAFRPDGVVGTMIGVVCIVYGMCGLW